MTVCLCGVFGGGGGGVEAAVVVCVGGRVCLPLCGVVLSRCLW